jgi:hypothetical protein
MFLGVSSWKPGSALTLNANMKGYGRVILSYDWAVMGTENLPERVRVQYSSDYGWSWKDVIGDTGIIDIASAEVGFVYHHTVTLPKITNNTGNLRVRWVIDVPGEYRRTTFAIGNVELYDA